MINAPSSMPLTQPIKFNIRVRRILPFFEKLKQPDSFLGPILTLVTGAAAAHLITAGALIILTRLYSPAEFGILAVFTAIFFSLSVISCLRYDIAIPLPGDEREALPLLALSLLSAILVASVVALVVAVIPTYLLDAVGGKSAQPYLWLLPLVLLISGFFAAAQSWMIRRRNYKSISRVRIAQSACAASAQIGAGLTGFGPGGLITGVILNSGAGAAMFARNIFADVRTSGGWPSAKRVRDAAIQYKRFPLYSTWEAVANSMAIQMPILIVAALTNEGELGQLMLALNVIQAPMALFGNATAQVYLSQAPEQERAGTLTSFTRRTLWHLLRGAAPFAIGIALLAPWFFPIVFGPEWHRSGILAAFMAPWLLLQFAFSPVSMVFHIVGRQRLAMALQIGGLAIRVCITLAGGILLSGHAAEFYALSGAVFYGLAIMLVMYIIREKRPTF